MRKIQRQMKRAAARRDNLTEEALEIMALHRYGPETRIADLHPDVRELFQLALGLNYAVIQNDPDTTIDFMHAICAMITRYSDQDLRESSSHATMSPITDTGHDNAQTTSETANVVGASGES